MLAAHIKSKAEVTIATTPVSRDDAAGFGIMDTDEDGRITRFVEKPKDPELLGSLKMPANMLADAGLSADEERFQASMGIYIFNRSTLEECLDNDKDDFGGDIIPSNIESRPMFSYVFGDYWEDIGTIKAFYEANLDLTSEVPRYNFFDYDNPIYSRARFLPASKVNNATLENALVSDGCIIFNATIRRSLIGLRSVIEDSCTITESIIMGSDHYEKRMCPGETSSQARPIRIGAGTRIHKAIVDKNAIIGKNVVIDPGDHVDADFEHAYVRDGIVIVTKSADIPDNTVVCETPLDR
jgi:glucose-1-phosphate adenylyltransferase